jgi:hypothetical protein
MHGFSISEAAFTGFRIVRERPRAVVVWALIQLAVSLIGGAALVAMAGPDLMRLRALSAAAGAPDGREALALLGRLAPAYGLVFLYLLAFSPLLYAAMNRAVMRPAADRFGYFRLGADELRQFLLMLLTFAVVLAGYVVVILVAFVVATIVALAAKPAAGLAVVLIGLIAAGAAVFVAVRLSLASAQTFATGKVTLFGSWALTRGRFWPILGTYVLAWAFAGVVYVLWFVLSFALVAVIGGTGAPAANLQPDLGSLAAFLSPAALARTVLGAVVTALLWPVLGAPPAVIYRRLTSPGPVGRAA